MSRAYLYTIQTTARAGILFALLCVLAACAARPATVPALESRFVTNPTPSPAPPPDTLFVIGRFTGADEAQFRALLETFRAETGITVRYEGNGEVAELLRQSVERGQTPDVILLPKTNWLYELASAGAITPLAPESAAAMRANFSAAWQETVSYEGTLYGVPFDANLKSLLWYRPAPGESVPATLSELLALARERTEGGEATFTVTGGADWMLTDWFENVLLATAGTETYDALMRHEMAWTDGAVVEAARAYAELLAPAQRLDGAAGATLPLDETAFARTFTGGESRFWLGQGSIVSQYAQNLGLTQEAYALAPFPTGGARVVVGSVAVSTNERTESAAFLHWLATPEAVEPWVLVGGLVSPNLALPPSDYPTEVARAEADLLANAPALRPDLSDQLPPHLSAFLGVQLRELLNRPDAIEQILAEIERVATREQGRVRGE